MLRFSTKLFVLVALACLLEFHAWADPQDRGEAAVVVHHCGKPNAEDYGTSPTTGKLRRQLYYGDTILHFQPIENGWGFTTAWQGSFPISRSALEARMPCFHQAMLEVAASPSQTVDPTIALQTLTPSVVGPNSFGVPFLWLIFVLATVVILVAALPASRKKDRKIFEPSEREFRKPGVLSDPLSARSRRPDRLDF